QQDLLVIHEPLLDGGADLAHQQVELLPGCQIAVVAQLVEDDQLAQQGTGQCQPGQAVAPGEEVRQANACGVVGSGFTHRTQGAFADSESRRACSLASRPWAGRPSCMLQTTARALGALPAA